MMRSILTTILLAIALTAPVQARAETVAADESPFGDAPPLRVGVTVEFEPISFEVSGELQGIEIDFATRIGDHIKRPVEYRIYAFKDLIDALRAGEIDIIMAGMSITEDRQDLVRFTEPYMEIGQMAIVRADEADRFSGPDALTQAGIKVGVHQGSTGEDYVLNNLTYANMLAFESVEEGLAALREGEIDTFIHDSTTSWQLSRSFVNDRLLSLNRFLTRESIAWATRRDDRELHTMLNLVLQDMKSKGEVKAVILSWLPMMPVAL